MIVMKIYDLLSSDSYEDKKLIEKLICIFENLEKKDLPNSFENIISAENIKKIDKVYNEIFYDKKPIEYALWFVEFDWRKYIVNENTIIPRQETNFMIKAVKDYLEIENDRIILLDIWAGCWVLALAVFEDFQEKIEKVILTDISQDALDVAKLNTEKNFKNDKNIELIESDLIKNISKSVFNEKVILVANLPYIPNKVFEENAEENTKKYEPSLAFLWWEDGLKLYREMFEQLIDMNPKNTIMFLEMMEEQIEILKQEYKSLKFEIVEQFNFGIRIVKVYL